MPPRASSEASCVHATDVSARVFQYGFNCLYLVDERIRPCVMVGIFSCLIAMISCCFRANVLRISYVRRKTIERNTGEEGERVRRRIAYFLCVGIRTGVGTIFGRERVWASVNLLTNFPFGVYVSRVDQGMAL